MSVVMAIERVIRPAIERAIVGNIIPNTEVARRMVTSQPPINLAAQRAEIQCPTDRQARARTRATEAKEGSRGERRSAAREDNLRGPPTAPQVTAEEQVAAVAGTAWATEACHQEEVPEEEAHSGAVRAA